MNLNQLLGYEHFLKDEAKLTHRLSTQRPCPFSHASGTAVCFAMLLLVAGCYSGDPSARRTVSLNVPMPEGQKVNLSVNDTRVQEALKLIDGVLVSAGYVRDTPPAPNDQGIIGSYGICNVLLKGNTLSVSFFEFHVRRSSAHVKKTCNLLKDRLSSRYGAHRVKIEH